MLVPAVEERVADRRLVQNITPPHPSGSGPSPSAPEYPWPEPCRLPKAASIVATSTLPAPVFSAATSAAEPSWVSVSVPRSGAPAPRSSRLATIVALSRARVVTQSVTAPGISAKLRPARRRVPGRSVALRDRRRVDRLVLHVARRVRFDAPDPGDHPLGVVAGEHLLVHVEEQLAVALLDGPGGAAVARVGDVPMGVVVVGERVLAVPVERPLAGRLGQTGHLLRVHAVRQLLRRRRHLERRARPRRHALDRAWTPAPRRPAATARARPAARA